MAERHSIHTALAAVMRSIGGVSKSDWNEHQRFNFRGIDALHNAVYGPLCEHGVFVTPEVLDAHYADVVTSQNKPARQATLRVRYTFHGPAGDSLAVTAQGEAMDSADKATSKALAMAFKYALLQTFVIPTEDQDDADAHTPERGQPQPKAAAQPAPAAPEPAPEQPTSHSNGDAPAAWKPIADEKGIKPATCLRVAHEIADSKGLTKPRSQKDISSDERLERELIAYLEAQ